MNKTLLNKLKNYKAKDTEFTNDEINLIINNMEKLNAISTTVDVLQNQTDQYYHRAKVALDSGLKQEYDALRRKAMSYNHAKELVENALKGETIYD